MKTLADLRTKVVIAESTVAQDPPTVLVLRRKAIRLFPHGQRVATYKNDNLDIEIAVPYTPGKLGHSPDHVSGTLTAEETIDEAMSPELKRIRKERGMFKRDLSRAEDRFDTSKQRLDWAKKALEGHIKKHGKTLDPIGECIQYMTEDTVNEMSAEGLFGEYLHKPGRDLVHHVQTKWGQKAAHHFIKAAENYGKDYKAATHHFDAFKRYVSEEIIDELSKQVLGTYVKKAANDVADNVEKANHYTDKPIKYHRDKVKKRLSGIEKATGKLAEDEIMEATIHSLHAITRTQHPAQVRFKDGSSAMIDHPTAAQIMKLHSKVNRQNKKKIESLINGGPTGIRKVSDFIRDHMK